MRDIGRCPCSGPESFVKGGSSLITYFLVDGVDGR